MRPKPKEKENQMEMFERELDGLVNPEHPLVKLGKCIDWTVFEKKLGATYHETKGAPGVNTRLMVALHPAPLTVRVDANSASRVSDSGTRSRRSLTLKLTAGR